MITVLNIVGTRPEVIKMAPVISALNQYPDQVRPVLCSTGQHREMVDQALALFSLKPDHDLDLMQPDQTLSALTARLFAELDHIVKIEKPDWILAQGDTTTVFVSAMIAYYHKVKFGHVEAGLRTGNRFSPFPEEANRMIADLLADLCFAPTEHSQEILLGEGHRPDKIVMTGNTIVDALLMIKQQPYDWSQGPLARIPRDRQIVVITAHRRESFGKPLEQICLAIRDLALSHQAQTHFVFPVHYNPNVREVVFRYLADLQNITLLDPLDYAAMIHLMSRAALILTDSGGIQEEGPSLGVPVLVMRESTERPEGIWTGAVQLVGTERQRIVYEVERCLGQPGVALSDTHVAKTSPYGDGMASCRIVAAILNFSQLKD